MRFKLFNLMWDLRIVFAFFWFAIIPILLIASPFVFILDNYIVYLPYTLIVIAYVATVGDIEKKLLKGY